LWQFDPNTDGDGPSTLVQGSSAPGTTNRYFYGVTTGGGPGSNGTVFAITPGGSLTNLHAFNYTQGSYPAGLTQGRDGNFYGVTEAGGSNNNGVVFMISSNINTVNSHAGQWHGHQFLWNNPFWRDEFCVSWRVRHNLQDHY
jgi:uncharacterized repeat protein (TIGR03803 family)